MLFCLVAQMLLYSCYGVPWSCKHVVMQLLILFPYKSEIQTYLQSSNRNQAVFAGLTCFRVFIWDGHAWKRHKNSHLSEQQTENMWRSWCVTCLFLHHFLMRRSVVTVHKDLFGNLAQKCVFDPTNSICSIFLSTSPWLIRSLFMLNYLF